HSDQQLVDWLATSIRVSRFGLQPPLVWQIGSGVTFSFPNLCHKISEKNSSCSAQTRSAHLSYCVLITNFGGSQRSSFWPTSHTMCLASGRFTRFIATAGARE